MEDLKFTIEEKEIAELLGRQNYSSKESAIFELVKNCYDAASNICNIYIDKNCIKIVDDGSGMNSEDIRSSWMHVGKSSKGYKDSDSDRVLAGSKGVGRFALARLGDRIQVSSKKENEKAVIWKTDWITNSLREAIVDFNKGTVIELNNLRDHWKRKDVDKLIDFLSRSYKGSEMKINIDFEGGSDQVISVFNDVEIGKNYTNQILLSYDSENMKLTVTINSDEFNPEVQKIIGSISQTHYEDEFNMVNELNLNTEEFEHYQEYLKELGEFTAELYFGMEKVPLEMSEKFKYKYNNLTTKDTKIILYRNAFSISSLDGTKDWLDIASRARKSPAAATHQTGSWRVRLNQIYGFVQIDKITNANLKDLGNRQGLEEDDYYQLFKDIISFGISRFEKHRQSIIRKIDESTTNIKHKKNERKNINDFLKKPSTVTQMTEKEISSLAQEIKDIQREAKEQSKAREESEQQHKYDVRILNVLATQGLRASAIAHELHNKRNSLESGYRDIVNALEEYGFWEELKSEKYTRVTYKNVPKILDGLEEINRKLIAFIDVILNKIEKEKFSTKIDSIESALNRVIDTWKKEYDWLNFEINIKNQMPEKYKISKDVLEVIFDNLILNSIQHNEMKDLLIIKMEVEKVGDMLEFKYFDNGKGLDEKYISDPKRILEVHETSRSDGHGLGMWIVSNTLRMYGGEVIDINSEKGFNIYFSIKG
ncbi:Signal transduction histidine kinase [Fontibacillus panacisegetis]|uniref:histidine kinase n=1 Tax=Fontibacillus panacisegetis TaxID=670482 RepID=A0A1G7SUY2_9BACL|nr:sensor histidine kinase [Fontibacillus panacisegetis]SDG26887.1 Signal transduction histidine kinase [Fontibacillus panacisegetis]